MSDLDPPHASVPTPPPLPAGAARGVRLEPIPYAMPGLSAPYASAWPRARVVIGLSSALIALQLMMVWPAVDAGRWWGMGDAAATEWEPLGGRHLRPIAAVARTVPGRLFSILYVVTVVFWCAWVHRTYRNLRALGAAGMEWTPGWAVAYYFIPLFNLVRPYQVMRETWRASDPRYAGPTDWKALAAPPLLGWWWAMHLVTFFVSVSTVRIALRPKDPATEAVAAAVNAAMLLFDIAVLLVEIRIVRELTARQEQRADAVGIPTGNGSAPGILPHGAQRPGDARRS